MFSLETDSPGLDARDAKVWHIIGLLGITLYYSGIVTIITFLTFIAWLLSLLIA
jgi:hypothetical protein